MTWELRKLSTEAGQYFVEHAAHDAPYRDVLINEVAGIEYEARRKALREVREALTAFEGRIDYHRAMLLVEKIEASSSEHGSAAP